MFAVGFALLLLIAPAYGAEITLAWDDPNNDPAEVGGYNLYYWQLDWDTPARINVGKQTTYTLTDLEAGETYYIAVTAYDSNGEGESDFSDVVDTNETIFVESTSLGLAVFDGIGPGATGQRGDGETP